MKKIISVLFLFVCLPSVLPAQSAEKLFISMPEFLSLTLTETNRLELVELYKGGLLAAFENQMGDSCFLPRMTDDYLQIREGESSLEIIILPMINDSKVVCLIHTVCAPLCDSYLEFYTVNWKKLNNSAFITPAGKMQFIKAGVNPGEQKTRNALIPLDISLMQFCYNPDSRELLQYYNTPQYLSVDDREKVAPYLKETPVVFKWNQIRFEGVDISGH
ncbi:MAG: DUF3256 family protein [Dysgonamonadaceae bacterium]|jgi:hypothetical protein|nr:DUF3256 family protein [Dysgonamonadaceae bacterium]